MLVRRLSLIACLAAFLVAVSVAGATTPVGFGNASCLRGEWRAGRAETARVVRSMVPVPGMQVNSTLYMIFRDNAFQYGTTSMIVTMESRRRDAHGQGAVLHAGSLRCPETGCSASRPRHHDDRVRRLQRHQGRQDAHRPGAGAAHDSRSRGDGAVPVPWCDVARQAAAHRVARLDHDETRVVAAPRPSATRLL